VKLSNERLLEMFRQMCEIRHFEQVVDGLFARGLVHGTMHLSIGQEASAVGSISAIEDEDYILSTHRGHGHCIAKGADLKLMMAELLGKETGYCRGRGGHRGCRRRQPRSQRHRGGWHRSGGRSGPGLEIP